MGIGRGLWQEDSACGEWVRRERERVGERTGDFLGGKMAKSKGMGLEGEEPWGERAGLKGGGEPKEAGF